MKYQVVEVRDDESLGDIIERLEENVQYFLDSGWELQGGVSIASNDGEYIVAQAMIKK